MSGHSGLFKPVHSSTVTASNRLLREDQSNSIAYQLLGDSSNTLKMIDECIDVADLPVSIQVSYLLHLMPAKQAFYHLRNQSVIDLHHDVPEAKDAVMALIDWVIEHSSFLTKSYHHGLVEKIIAQKEIIEIRAKGFGQNDIAVLKAQDHVGLFTSVSRHSEITTGAHIEMNMNQR